MRLDGKHPVCSGKEHSLLLSKDLANMPVPYAAQIFSPVLQQWACCAIVQEHTCMYASAPVSAFVTSMCTAMEM